MKSFTIISLISLLCITRSSTGLKFKLKKYHSKQLEKRNVEKVNQTGYFHGSGKDIILKKTKSSEIIHHRNQKKNRLL